MSTDIDWRRELDSSFGTGQDVPVGHYVASGHRAVRRRRSGVAVASLAVAAIVVGAGWGLGGGTPSSEAPVATDPTASGTPRAEDPADSRPWRPGEAPARLMPDGVDLRPGAVVDERRDDLFPGKDTESVALDVTWQGERWWVTLEWDGHGGGATSSARPEEGLYASFDDFVRDSVKGGGLTSEPSTADDEAFAGLVEWDGTTVTPRQGVVVERTVEDPMGADGDSLGLELRKGDETTWMLVQLDDHGSSSSWTAEADSGWATFDQWLADMVALQEDGTGVQLLRIAPDGTLSSGVPGVEVLAEQAAPDLRAYGTEGAGVRSAVAQVEWSGERWWVLAVRLPDQQAVTPVAASKAPGVTTLDEFVAFMADRADEGGMR